GDPTFPSQSVFLLAFSHYAGLSRDGKVLLVGDENGGGLGPVGCVAAVDTPQGRVSVPVGAVWFYDVSDETNPVYLSHVSASQMERVQSKDPSATPAIDPTDPVGTAAGAAFGEASCTAHHGRLVPLADHDVLAMSFYGAGVLVIDFTAVRQEGVGLPTVVAQYAGTGANVWETWYYNGYLFTGDMGRGMDVIDFV
ncbi:MAG: LVIVD repeat-containing protein, partial [Thermoplasmatota archaeon]